jgi:hypothetical protein
MRAKEFTIETALGTNPKRPARPGARPTRGHKEEPRYKEQDAKEGTVTRTATGLKHQASPGNYGGYEPDPDPLAKLDKSEINRTDKALGVKFKREKKFGAGLDLDEQFCEECGGSLAEAGKASRELCKSSKPDADLGASMLSSCKSQGLRARDGEKSHKLGKSPDSRVKVGGHRIKGRKYGGPLPDWS